MCKHIRSLALMVWIYGVLKIWRKRMIDLINQGISELLKREIKEQPCLHRVC